MTALNKLTQLVKKRKTIGRGGSRGGTSGKGHKGQKARSGAGNKISAWFEGGQMPLTRRMPKRGFSNARFKVVYEIVNLSRLEEVFDNEAVIDKNLLVETGVIKGGKKALVKILGDGSLTKKFSIQADAFSKTAKEAVISKGGEVRIIKEM